MPKNELNQSDKYEDCMNCGGSGALDECDLCEFDDCNCDPACIDCLGIGRVFVGTITMPGGDTIAFRT